jgi:hypothetical protein
MKVQSRQQEIVSIIQSSGPISVTQIRNSLSKPVSQVTVNRDLASLVKRKEISKKGFSRNIKYEVNPHLNLLAELDSEKYFAIHKDQRSVRKVTINDTIKYLKENPVFSLEELKVLAKLQTRYQENLKKAKDKHLIKEFNCLNLNLCRSLEETENSQVLVNNKSCLNFIWKNSSKFSKLNSSKIKKLNTIFNKYLANSSDLRNKKITLDGSNYIAPETKFAIKNALQKCFKFINEEENLFKRSIYSLILLNFIQPLKNNNLKVSQIASSAILISDKCFPIIFDQEELNKALIIFLEQQNPTILKNLFLKSAKEVVENYFN